MIAVYPGSFDPITFGHLDVIERGARLFTHLIVAVAVSESKTALFSMEERLEMIEAVVGHIPNVKVDTFRGMIVDYVQARQSRTLLRGIRTMSDFEYEFQMAMTNRTFAPDVETVFIMASLKYSFISSRLIKGSAAAGGNISAFVPALVEQRLKAKLKERGPLPPPSGL
ncbi:MAG: pantetheine-phosphate adenylyltransferase [Planctomycetota bacterium]